MRRREREENEKKSDVKEEEEEDPLVSLPKLTEAKLDCFDMVSQLPWEKDIIWDGEEAKEKVLSSKAHELAGWIPTLSNRTALAYYTNKGLLNRL